MTTRNHATVLSTHRTSEGTIRYVRLPDGSVQVQLQPTGAPVHVVGTTSPAKQGIASAQAGTGSDDTRPAPAAEADGRDLARCA